MEKWTLPEYYAGASWPDYFVFLGRNRDSDDLQISNFEIALAQLGGESETVIVVHEGHWACGWIDWIAIHESDTKAIEIAESIECALADYPVLDDDDFSEREQERANFIWRDCYDPGDRIKYIRKYRDQFDFHNFADLLACVRGEYFAGYASELLY